MLKKIVIVVVGIVVVAAIGLGARMYWLGKKSSSVVNNKLGVVEGHLQACGEKPNCVSSSADPASDFYIEPIQDQNIEGTWDDLNMLLQDMLKDKSRFKILKQETNYIHIMAISKIFGFIDDVEFHLVPEKGLIEIRSQSRVGYSDMGANRKRLEKIRKQLHPKLK